MATVQQLKAFAPELASVSNARLQIFLDIASKQIAASVWGSSYDTAHILLAAHCYTLANRTGGAVGPVTSEKVGDIQVSYGKSGDDTDALNSTSYGALYLQLRDATIINPTVSG